MIATDAEVLACLRLVRGRSDAERRDFIRGRGQAVITVGADPECDWLVEEAGVAPVHFSLHWDGSTLRIADTHNAGKVRVDGLPVGIEWRRIAGRARVDFGNAAIVVETLNGRAEVHTQTLHDRTLPEVAAIHLAGVGRTGTPSTAPGPSASVRPQAVEVMVDPAANRYSKSVAPASHNGTRAKLGGTSLADIDQRTMQGYVPPSRVVQVAGSVTIAGTGASIYGDTRSSPLPPAAGDKLTRPEVPMSSESPATGMIVHRQEEADARSAHGKGSDGPPRRRSVAPPVLVLSPTGSSGSEPPEATERPSFAARRARTLPGWRPIVLGLLAVAVGYACWLYLLYNL